LPKSVRHFIYPLSAKSKYRFDDGEGGFCEISPENYWRQALKGATVAWGLKNSYLMIQPGDWVWAYFSLPVGQIVGVGEVLGAAEWDTEWGYFVDIRWDAELTAAIKADPIHYADYRQRVQQSAIPANEDTLSVFEDWLRRNGSAPPSLRLPRPPAKADVKVEEQPHGDRGWSQPPGSVVCPECGGRGVPVVAGFPMPEVMAAAERGEVMLWGCDPTNAPSWQCTECKHVGLDVLTGYAQALRAADGDVARAEAPRTWSEIGLDRARVCERGLVGVDLPLVIRGYIVDGSEWSDLQDEPSDGRFTIESAVLRADDRRTRALAPGAVVMYFDQEEDTGEPILWSPALVVRIADTAPRRRTAWALRDGAFIDHEGRPYVTLRSLPGDVQKAAHDLLVSGNPATPEQRALLLPLFHLAT
jgi:hypothetical protein